MTQIQTLGNASWLFAPKLLPKCPKCKSFVDPRRNVGETVVNGEKKYHHCACGEGLDKSFSPKEFAVIKVVVCSECDCTNVRLWDHETWQVNGLPDVKRFSASVRILGKEPCPEHYNGGRFEST